MLKLYGFSRVNAFARGQTRDLRVLWALEELQLPFEIVGLDHPAHDLNTDAYRRCSPFEQIPAIDDDGVVVSESAAILIYLAKKAGRLIPADLAGEAQVVRWSFAAMNSVEPPLLNLLVMDFVSPQGGDKYRGFLNDWVTRVLGNLDRWLTDREFIATDDFTVADILMAHVLGNTYSEPLVAPYLNVVAYRDRCMGRPAWQRTRDAYFARVEES